MTAPQEPEKEGGVFLQFLNGLAVQTLIHLGKVAYPESGRRAVDLPNARFSIDILGALEEKTKGNLTPDESRYLAGVLFDLRSEYVRVTEKNGGDDGPSAPPPQPEEGA